MPRDAAIKIGERDERPAGRRNLVDVVGQQLRQAILGGALKPGEKLPSESGLTEQYKVSRTVIREAIASMRADGLVEVRHGVGVFVRNARPFPAAGLLGTDTGRISSIIEMLELRAAVETEAAGLAAARRSPAQDEAIIERFEDIDRAMERGIATSEADFEFHLAIADATNNPRFREFLELTGKKDDSPLLSSGSAGRNCLQQTIWRRSRPSIDVSLKPYRIAMNTPHARQCGCI